jgi:DNA-binding LacI/PurR family transcriptional regulator
LTGESDSDYDSAIMLRRGHRRIGLATRVGPMDTSFEDGVRGFRQVLGAAGASVPPVWDVRTTATGIDDGVDAADQILAIPKRPTAIFATTDRLAMGLIPRLLEHGVRVPEDIAVVCYDGIPFAACSQLPLTTVGIPVRQVGQGAAELLFDRMEGKELRERQRMLIGPEFMVRASCP